MLRIRMSNLTNCLAVIYFVTLKTKQQKPQTLTKATRQTCTLILWKHIKRSVWSTGIKPKPPPFSLITMGGSTHLWSRRSYLLLPLSPHLCKLREHQLPVQLLHPLLPLDVHGGSHPNPGLTGGFWRWEDGLKGPGEELGHPSRDAEHLMDLEHFAVIAHARNLQGNIQLVVQM